ncbi:MAG: UvrD-helicase domain-containing protein [Vulcanococcus sp.]
MTLAAFDANGFSLAPGIRLLEASAGTGKTFALAHLVLRLLSEGRRPLEVEELLVVTFTDAAAAELRDRIARRLQEALVLLDRANPEADEPLQQWRSALQADQVMAIKGRLLLALERLDRADITTIHGFCRRTLQRHALEAGLGPEVALESQGRERRQQLVHDYWQQQVLPLPPHLLAGLQSQQVNPEQLVNLLGSLDGDPALQLAPLPEGWSTALTLAEQLAPHWSRVWQQFQAEWEARSEALEEEFAAAAVELKSLGVKYAPYRLKAKPDRLNRVQTWLSQLEAPAGYDALLQQEELKKYFHPGPFTKAAARPTAIRSPCPRPPCSKPSPRWWRGLPS